VPEGKFQGRGEGPEYESIYALGSDCGIEDLAAITKANYLCNELGLDTMSMGATIACAMELYEKGLLPESEIGRPLRFGDAEAVVELVQQTAFREGFGELLAQGSARLADRYGHPHLAMVSKKQEFAGYDPRGAQGLGLAYATSPIGASHMRALTAYTELFNVPVPTDPHSWEDKPRLVKDWQDVFALIDASGLCTLFTIRNLVSPTIEIKPEGLMDLVNAATGANYNLDEFLRVGERIVNAERLFLNRAGIDRAQDTLPPRLTEEPLPGGPAQGKVCRLDDMLPLYYQARGWDDQGRPTSAKLAELGLG
jgi:aldehyde:ferredoxin oxidoreductase